MTTSASNIDSVSLAPNNKSVNAGTIFTLFPENPTFIILYLVPSIPGGNVISTSPASVSTNSSWSSAVGV